MSIKVRISLLFALIVTIILLLLNVSVYYFTAVDRKEIFKKRLKNRAVSTAQAYTTTTEEDNLSMLQKMDITGLASLHNKSVFIFDFNNRPLYVFDDDGKDSLFLSKDIIEKAKRQKELYFTIDGKEAVSLQYRNAGRNLIVVVAAYDEDGLDNLKRLKNILLISLLIAIVVALVFGYFFSQGLARPIIRMARQTNLISSSNFSSRLETGRTKDELYHLTASFNNLLDRLQDSFQIQRRFISNASHELSTPLTSISSQLEVTLQKERTLEEYKRMIISVQEDVLQLQQLTRSLLEIAKTGTHGSIDLKEVRVDEVIVKVASDIKKQNPDCNLKIDFGEFPDDEGLLDVFGNADLLFSAFKNIVENGCKYSEDKTVAVRIDYIDNNIKIKIHSKGDVIAESDIRNIFEPFFRAGPALVKPGFGLGLTLAKRIISMHKGNIDVTSDPETGTIFTILLPSILDFE